MTLELNNTTSLFRSFMKSWLDNRMIAVDMTVGNGNDSEFLLSHNIKYLYGFDIQKRAIEITQNRLEKSNYSNFMLFQDNHKEIKRYIQEKVDLLVYNLGYLPKGNKEITTKGIAVVESLKKGLDLLLQGGMVWITFYPGHPAGYEESIMILDFVKGLDQRKFHVLKMDYINQINYPPFSIALEKRY